MNEQNRSKLKYIFLGLAIAFVLMSLIFVDINIELSKLQIYVNLKNNIKFMVRVISTSLPVIFFLVMFIVYKVLNQRLVFRVEKLNLGGLNIIFDNPNKIFIQQVKNFLNTKRTLFKLDVSKDNFYETIDSYYSVYNFLREEIKVFDSKSSKECMSYSAANNMLQELNIFLTTHQNNFKRWFEYVTDKNIDTNYNKDINEIQQEYRNYTQIVDDFKKLNKVFCSIASVFEIDINKWDIY